jgi:hypothetical protein
MALTAIRCLPKPTLSERDLPQATGRPSTLQAKREPRSLERKRNLTLRPVPSRFGCLTMRVDGDLESWT